MFSCTETKEERCSADGDSSNQRGVGLSAPPTKRIDGCKQKKKKVHTIAELRYQYYRTVILSIAKNLLC